MDNDYKKINDLNRLRQALVILISNSIKFTVKVIFENNLFNQNYFNLKLWYPFFFFKYKKILVILIFNF